MKRSNFYIMVLGVVLCMVSCKNSSKTELIDHEIKVYHQALNMDDDLTAIHAMQSILAWDSTQTKYYDTLALLFFHTQNYLGATHCARLVLEKDPNNADILALAGNSYQELGRFDLAIPVYAKLMEVKPNIVLNYELAKCNLYSQDTAGAHKYINVMLHDKSSDSTKINIAYNSDHDHQMVSLKAAAYNLLGSMQIGQEKRSEALLSFQKALAIFPGFELAKQNINIVKSGVTQK